MKERWGISGIHGFCGSALASKLLKEDLEVIEIPRSGYLPPNLDHIVLFGAYGNMYGQNDAIEIYKTNVLLPIQLLDQVAPNSIKSIILTSSSSVELDHQTLYSASKKAMEEIAQIYMVDRNLPIKIARPFSIYGNGEQKEHLIPKLIDSCLNGTEMPFVGEPKHDFVYIDDFIDVIIKMSTPPFEGLPGIWRVGSGKTVSNEEVKDIIQEVTDKKANIKRVESLRDYDSDNWPAGNDFGNKVDLEEGIRRMVNEQTK